MKKLLKAAGLQLPAAVVLLIIIAGFGSCKKSDDAVTAASRQSVTQVNLVASTAAFTGARVDAGLINAWGIAFSPTGTAWVSAAGAHTSVIYSAVGAQVLAPVTIPTHGATTGGTPTGQVFNSTTDFKLPNTNPAKFIFAGVDGIISGWNGGTAAVTAVDRNSTSVYTGLAIGASGAGNFLYAADFGSGKIDKFDNSFVLQANSFIDPALPAGYAPFNIQNIGGLLYVTYAQPDPVTHEKKGAGLGIVSIFNSDGSFVKRFVTGGALNAPWGIAQAPAGWLTYAASGTTVILIGNFGRV